LVCRKERERERERSSHIIAIHFAQDEKAPYRPTAHLTHPPHIYISIYTYT
jgi:hypothetical protein